MDRAQDDPDGGDNPCRKIPQFNEILINPKDIPIEVFFSWIDHYIIILILIDLILII